MSLRDDLLTSATALSMPMTYIVMASSSAGPKATAVATGLAVTAAMTKLFRPAVEGLRKAAGVGVITGLFAAATVGVVEVERAEAAEQAIIAKACKPEYGPYTDRVQVNGQTREIQCNMRPVAEIQ